MNDLQFFVTAMDKWTLLRQNMNEVCRSENIIESVLILFGYNRDCLLSATRYLRTQEKGAYYLQLFLKQDSSEKNITLTHTHTEGEKQKEREGT